MLNISLPKFAKNLNFLMINLFFFLALFSVFVGDVCSNQIDNIMVRINNDEIYVTTNFIPDSNFIESITAGVSKEVVFYIDLFRIWNVWPNEFVKGAKIMRILKSDPIKREYSVITFDNNQTIEKRFKDISGMLSWGLTITDYKITNIKDLEPGSYFIKVTVESNIKRLPPFVGYFLFFLSQSEFTVSKKSHRFMINPLSN